MIPAITEVNFPSYATLHQATVSLQEMGERTISTQVRIDGSVVPDFTGWELRFKGERFILPTRTPQAQKDNTTKNAIVDLQFKSWVIEQLKSYFFVSLSEYETGKYIPDQYNASVVLPLEGFVQLFNRVLQYYFGTGVRMDLFGVGQGIYSTEPVSVDINKTYIWDVLVKFYELFNVRWYIVYEQATGAYVIKVGYTAEAITDHDFEYGYNGGLLKFERHVQDADVRNILLGRGGEKNLPYRYFKLQDPNSTAWEADPDAIPELANIHFDRLRDINFRWYVRGWMQNSHRDTSWDGTHTFPQYTENECPEAHLFAFRKGKTDESFDPVEYVKDDDSITKYGERWGAVDDNDDVYPTIQGMVGTNIGRVDQCVAVSDIITDDIQAAASAASTTSPIGGTKVITKSVPANGNVTDTIFSNLFTIQSGQTGNIQYSWMNPRLGNGGEEYPEAEVWLDATVTNIVAVDQSTGTEYPVGGLQAGTYRLKVTLKAMNATDEAKKATYGLNEVNLVLSAVDENAWKPTFDVWVKNIWETTQGQGETDAQYATRVWEKILGDRVGNEAKLVFSDGFMSISQDYEFVIAAYPVKDRSKTITVVEDGQTKTYTSEWKITLYKSDAEFEATGLYIPNSTTGGKPAAGDHFYFIGIDMPFLYVTRAEERLNGADLTPVVNKTKALSDLSEVQPTWLITLDKVRVNTLEAGEYGQTLADRLSAGATVRITDPRFTQGQVLTLYVKSITYTWNEPTSGNPYLVPDIEVVLSDTVASVEGTVTRVANELDVVKATYAKSADVEAAVRSVGNALFLKKTGEADSSNSPTTFASKVTSKRFLPGGIGGAGWGFYEEDPAKVMAPTRSVAAGADEERSNSVLEIDKLVVRKELHVNELISNQISYVGGKKITSAAAIDCTQVIEDESYYTCYFDQKQGTVANLFQVGDFAMGQDFSEENVEVKYYRMQVAAVGSNYIKLSKSIKDGAGVPVAGDTIIQYGNASDTSRQYVIVEDVIGGGYTRMISGLSSVDSNGTEYVFFGRQPSTGPRAFVGERAGEYIEWANGLLNIKGALTIRKSDGSYQSMIDYMAAVQAQIDGQIQSWASTQAPSAQTEPFPQYDPETEQPVGTANYPANGWATTVEKNKHVGDIYTDDTTGQAWRYSAGFYWVRITDEEAAAAMAIAQQAAAGVSGLQYLKQALSDGTTVVQGGLVLTNLIQLGYTPSGSTFQVMSGMNGTLNNQLQNPLKSIAAWYGGPMVDHQASPSEQSYAKSLFRFDGSGYLASGGIHWDSAGHGGIPGISWDGNSVIISGDVKLESLSGDSVTSMLTLLRQINNWFGEDANGDIYVKKNSSNEPRNFYSYGAVTAGGLNPGGGGGGGTIDLARMWQSLMNVSAPVADNPNNKIALAHIPNVPVSHINGLGSLATMNDITTAYITDFPSAMPASDVYAWAKKVNLDINDVPTIPYSKTSGFGAAALKGVASSVVSGDSANLVTGAAVYSAINSALSSAIKYQGITTTVLTDGATTNPIVINGESFTAHLGDEVIYGGKEFLYTGTVWQQLGDEESWALKTIQIIAGTGLTGGGTLEASRTLSLSAATIASLGKADTALQSADIYGLTINNYAGTALATYSPIGGAASVTLTKAVVGLGNVDNTADADKNVAYATNAGSAGNAGTLENHAASYFATASALSSVSNTVSALAARQNWDDIFGIDANGDVYVKKNGNVARGFYSYGFVTAGGLNPGGGGAGTIDLPRMWQALMNTNAPVADDPNNKIAVAHIPTLSIAQTTGLQSALDAKQNTISDLSTIRSRADEGHTAYGYFSSGILGTSHVPDLAISKITGLQTALDGKQSAYGFTINGTSGATYNLANFVTSSGVTSITAGTGLSGGTITSSGTIGIASGYKLPTTTEWAAKADASALAGYLPLSGGTMTGRIVFENYTSFGVTDGKFYLGHPSYPLVIRSSGTPTINGYTVITGANIGSQSVSYATTAGSAPASDVYSWAKQPTKPSYHAGELDITPRNYKVSYVAAGIAPYISEIGTNIFSGATTSEITVERSTDDGSTWVDVTAAEAANVKNVFSGCVEGALFVSARSHGEVGDKLRITFNPAGSTRYCQLAFIYIYYTTMGAGTTCLVEKNTYTDQNVWTTYVADAPISGWSGPNVIGMGGTYFGQGDSRNSGYGLRFTFRINSVNANYDSRGYIYTIQGFTSARAWGLPSGNSIARANVPYSFTNADRAVSFDNTVAASGFIRANSNDNYVLLGGGGHAALNTLSVNYASSAGSASSATALSTARTLWGQSFDGSSPVSGALTGVTNLNGLLYIGSSNVGVGQSSPSYNLDVSGTFRATGNSFIGGALSVTGTVKTGSKYYFGDTGAYLEYVNIGTAADPVYAIHSNVGIYSDSFVSAGGLNSQSGGGAGAGLADVWNSLTGTVVDQWANTQINLSHIPVIPMAKLASDVQNAISDAGRKVWPQPSGVVYADEQSSLNITFSQMASNEYMVIRHCVINSDFDLTIDCDGFSSNKNYVIFLEYDFAGSYTVTFDDTYTVAWKNDDKPDFSQIESNYSGRPIVVVIRLEGASYHSGSWGGEVLGSYEVYVQQ